MPPSCRPPPTGTGIGPRRRPVTAGARHRPRRNPPSKRWLPPAGGTMPESGDTHHRNSAPAPSPELQRLGALVGRWRSQGHIVGEDPVPITGTYQWLPGGFFLVHHVDVMIGGPAGPRAGADRRVRPGNRLIHRPRLRQPGQHHDHAGQGRRPGVWRFTGGGDVAPVARPAAADARGAARCGPR
jgi:hypothetical protein